MWHDLWYALRRLRSAPVHAAIVIAIFAVGMGAALTVLRIADAVLLRGLPYRDADRLVRIYARVPMLPTLELPASDVGFRAIELRTRTLEAVAGYRTVGVNLVRGETPERVLSARVTGNFFDALGARTQLGRPFRRGEEAERGPRIAVVSDALWRRSFGSAASIVGSTVRIDGVPTTVVGVADARLTFPSAEVGLWVLMDLDAVGTQPFELGLDVLARLRPGVTTASAIGDASRIMQEVARENPGPHSTPNADVSGFRAVMRPLRDDIAGGVTPTLVLLAVAVGCVLLLTCVNVATLQLVRSSERRGELAVRAALGAEPRRLVTGALAEGTIQAVAGGAAGLALSSATVRVLESLLPSTVAPGAGPLSGIAIASTVTMIALCAGAAAAFPVASALRRDLASALRDRAMSAARRIKHVRQVLIIAQMAFACVLVHGAALTIAAVRDAQRVSLGFRPEGLVTFKLSLPREAYSDRGHVVAAVATLSDVLRGAGASAVGLSTTLPLSGEANETLIGVEGRPFRADGTDPNVVYRVVTAGYFDAMGVRLISGRAFRGDDTYLDGTPVVISETMASLLFPDGGDPLGHRIRTGPFAPWMPIVGVVGDVKNRSVSLPSRPEMYVPFGAPRSPMGVKRDLAFVVRAPGSGAALTAIVQRAVRGANPELPPYDVRRYEDVLRLAQARELTTMRTLSVFAAIAVALAIAGSYALLLFAVVQRHRELALRRAVGATPRDVVQLIGREMGRLVGIGALLGVAGMFGLGGLLSRLMPGVSAMDPRASAATVVVVGLAGIAATLIPARRAAGVDPMFVLRSE